MRKEVQFKLTMNPIGSNLIWIYQFIHWYPYMGSAKWIMVQIRNMVGGLNANRYPT